MADDLVILDSNILLRWLQPLDTSFGAIKASIDYFVKAGAVLCYTSQNMAEFWNALTRPIIRNGYGLSPEQADGQASQIESYFRLLPDNLAVHEEWRRILVAYRISGVQVHDARLVAAMRVHGAKQILTLNAKDFTRFHDIRAVHPASLPRMP